MSADVFARGLSLVIGLLSFAMLLLAFSISIARTVRQMIPLYIYQTHVLALATVLTAVEPDPRGELASLGVGAFVLIPILLAVSIEPLLAQATVPENLPIWDRLRRLFPRDIRAATRARALPIWLEQRTSRRGEVLSLAFDLVLIVAAYAIAFSLVRDEILKANSLAVSLALLLLGLSILNNKQDLITQIMGLLVMEHGLFLAAIQVIPIPSVAIVFIISLFLYIIITLTILVFLLPELHRISGSIEVEDQQQLKG
jgi:hydrogenase-4 membrane subunit HyfE